jgi:hypothetical protein
MKNLLPTRQIVKILTLLLFLSVVIAVTDLVMGGLGMKRPKLVLPPTAEMSATQAISGKDPTVCEQIEDEARRKECWKYVITAKATTETDSSICNELEDDAARTNCQDTVLIARVLTNRDSGLCRDLINKSRLAECQQAVGSLR